MKPIQRSKSFQKLLLKVEHKTPTRLYSISVILRVNNLILSNNCKSLTK